MEHFNQEIKINPSETSTSNATPPAYLTSRSVSIKQLPLAIAISCLAFISLSLIAIYSSTLYLQNGPSHLLSLILGLFVLLSCTVAIWKHTFEH